MDDFTITSGRRRAHGSQQRSKELRVAVHRVEWLDGEPMWQDDRVVWKIGSDTFAPRPTDLARTHFRLRQLTENPGKARQLLKDPETWLARKWERFRVAEGLARLREPNLSLVAVRCGEGDRDAEDQCLGLLEAEAACVNGLPVSAARALSIPARGRSERIAVLLPTLSPAARTLAALSLNIIIERQYGQTRNGFSFAQGRLPERPDVIAALITAGADLDLVSRWLALDGDERFLLDPTTAKRLLRGTSAGEVVAIAEALGRFGEEVRCALSYRHLLPEHAKARDNAAVTLSAKREEALDCLAELMRGYVVEGSAELIATVSDYTATVSDLLRATGEWRLILSGPLEHGLNLRPEHRLRFARMLLSEQGRIWNRIKFKARTNDKARRTFLEQHCDDVKAIAHLATLVSNEQIASDLFAKGGQSCLRLPQWKDLTQYSRLADIVRRVKPKGSQGPFGHTLQLFEKLPGDGDLRALARLANTAQTIDTTQKQILLPELLSAICERSREDLIALLQHDRFRSAICLSSDILCDLIPGTEVLKALAEMIIGGHDIGQAKPFCALVREREIAKGSYNVNAGFLARCAAVICPHGHDFVTLFRQLFDYGTLPDTEHTRHAGAILKRVPALCKAIADDMSIEPRRCLAVLERQSTLSRFGSESVDVFVQGLARIPHPDQIAHQTIITATHPRWYKLHRLAPHLTEEIETLAAAQRILHGDALLPEVLNRIVDTNTRRDEELRYLESLVFTGVATEGQQERARKLRGINGAPSGTGAHRREIADRLPRIAAQAVITVAEQLLASAYRRRLELLAGPICDPVEIDEGLMDAVILTGNITSNRKILVSLVRSIVEGNSNWVATRPQNIAFLDNLRAEGVDTDHWLGAHHQTFPCPGVAGGQVMISLETDPIKILPMGSHFSTCLSVDSFNAFSVVANAVELNKRVIYAHDSKGRVVGRKLIGIGEDGKLLGFHTYASTADPAEHGTLVRLIDRYALEFAERCGLATGDDGTVPKLFVDEWYDDGAQAWADGAEPPAEMNETSGEQGDVIHEDGEQAVVEPLPDLVPIIR